MDPTAWLEIAVPVLPYSLFHACHMSQHLWYFCIPLYKVVVHYILVIYSFIQVGSL